MSLIGKTTIQPPVDLPVALYLWVPVLLTLSPYAAQWQFPEATWLRGERGVFEILTFLLLVVAIYFLLQARRTLAAPYLHPPPYLSGWLLLLLLGSLYFAGEEISWGQHFFLWQTPEVWQSVNQQQETNLHNVHALFDQLPRALLTLAALIGGILVPFYRWMRGFAPAVSEVAGWLWPTFVCAPVCLCALTISRLDDLIESRAEALPIWLDISGGEMKECLLALFILIYAYSLHKRLKAAFASGL